MTRRFSQSILRKYDRDLLYILIFFLCTDECTQKH